MIKKYNFLKISTKFLTLSSIFAMVLKKKIEFVLLESRLRVCKLLSESKILIFMN